MTKVAGEIEQPKLFLKMNWDDESQMFILTYVEEDRAIFQIKMTPDSFEQLSCDMIKVIKNYNLYRAQKYQEQLNAEKEKLKGESLQIGGGLPDSQSADSGDHKQPEQPKDDIGQGLPESSKVD